MSSIRRECLTVGGVFIVCIVIRGVVNRCCVGMFVYILFGDLEANYRWGTGASRRAEFQ